MAAPIHSFLLLLAGFVCSPCCFAVHVGVEDVDSAHPANVVHAQHVTGDVAIADSPTQAHVKHVAKEVAIAGSPKQAVAKDNATAYSLVGVHERHIAATKQPVFFSITETIADLRERLSGMAADGPLNEVGKQLTGAVMGENVAKQFSMGNLMDNVVKEASICLELAVDFGMMVNMLIGALGGRLGMKREKCSGAMNGMGKVLTEGQYPPKDADWSEKYGYATYKVVAVMDAKSIIHDGLGSIATAVGEAIGMPWDDSPDSPDGGKRKEDDDKKATDVEA